LHFVLYQGQIPLRRQVRSWSQTSSELEFDPHLAGLRQVYDQPRTCLRPG